ncbi:MAG: c-type cytochrome [Myxococcaceae bacterium]|nr:c-type cytochrome [Myxococcaceae bacterium]
MKRIGKAVGAAVLVVVIAAGAFFVWANVAASGRRGVIYDVHAVELPGERGPEAVARGEHLATSRYACVECHGRDLGGGTMVDAMPVGRFFGPNLTRGKGGVVGGYTSTDWDHIVRHGVKRDGTGALMPSKDFVHMSDRELADLVAYVESMPPVDREMPALQLGPLGTVLVATGELELAAAEIEDHHRAHPAEPPPTGETVEFGRHLTVVCRGCHGADLSGGPIAGGDPAWPPAANLTPHADGLRSWSRDDFLNAMLHARSKDGRALKMPMSNLTQYAAKATPTELNAMWAFLQSLSPKPTARP